MRHMMAVLTQPDRTAQLRQLEVPTLVVHGGWAGLLVEAVGVVLAALGVAVMRSARARPGRPHAHRRSRRRHP